MSSRIALVSLAALSLGLAGCGHKASQEAAADNAVASNDTTASSNDTVAGSNDSMAMESNSAAPAGAPAMTGQEFANAAAAGDAFEIAEAKLAKAKGKDASVKEFAAKMVTAHTESTAKIKKAAGEAKITPDPTMTSDQKNKIDALGKLSGDDFDKQYAADQADAHHMALAAMQGYAASGDVPSLKTTAGEIAPIVSSHIDMIKKLPGQ